VAIMSIDIVFEHVDWLLCYKPAGMDFHDDQGTPGFISHLKQQTKIVDLIPVHRLDKPTSGLILVAKTLDACQALNDLFSARNIEKYYLALCPNSLKKKQGMIKGDMEKSRRGTFKLLKSNTNPAVTQFFSHSLEAGIRLCILKPRTGKTHQLRVAMKSLSAPILGDQSYSGKVEDRLYLHAYALRFEYGGEHFEFMVPPKEGNLFAAEAFQHWLQTSGEPWGLNWPKSSN